MFEQTVTQSDQIEAVLPVPGAVRFNGTLVAQNVMAPSGDHLNQGLSHGGPKNATDNVRDSTSTLMNA